MMGFVIATHGTMSDGIVDAADLIIGDTENIETLNLFHGDDIEELNGKMRAAIAKVDKGEGIIIFTDLFGASPYNQATIAVHALPEEIQKQSFVLTGVNLPMVIEAINQRIIGTPVSQAVQAILSESQNSMLVWPNGDEQSDDDF